MSYPRAGCPSGSIATARLFPPQAHWSDLLATPPSTPSTGVAVSPPAVAEREQAFAPVKTGPIAVTGFNVIRRNRSVSAFDPTKIAVAMTKAFLAVEGAEAASSARVRNIVEQLCESVVSSLTRRVDAHRPLHIEDIQDQVELALMRGGHHKVARAYVLYREERARVRREREGVADTPDSAAARLHVQSPSGDMVLLDVPKLRFLIEEACAGLERVSPAAVMAETLPNLYDGMPVAEVQLALIMAARTLVETEPDYSSVSARLLLNKLRTEALTEVYGAYTEATQGEMSTLYAEYFPAFVRKGVEYGLLDPELTKFDLGRLAAALRPERDTSFQLLGLQTLYDRYFQHHQGVRFELPQAFFMRVAMGIAIREVDRDSRAIEFYNLLSSFDFMCSTPTLFNSGTPRPQLSSCFLTTVPDELDGIFKSIRDNALLAKYSGGLGNDWTRVRGLGAHIRGTNGKSQGVVPFLKVANDTAVAVNQGGKRKGAICAYLECWHVDIEEFLDLRKNTGDERRRTHDMNIAAWVPDLFMERVSADGEWTLFSPDEVPDLHDLYGKAFASRYAHYEECTERGEINVYKRVRAVELWRHMLSMLFETGHPWITFKDACNLRSPQQHVGVVHSSNLCTEITLNTSDDEIAVCNLGSVNLASHVSAGGLDQERLARTVETAVRMLDNVIDVNFYTVPEARTSNLRHRPTGLGLMGFQDALHTLRIPYASEEAVRFADESMEVLSYYAIQASSELAAERGRYSSYNGSLWSKGVLPIDSMDYLSDARGGMPDTDRSRRMDWDTLRAKVLVNGMRNSNVMAIAPTATISNICGVTQSIEPSYRNLYVKSNMSGDFTVVNRQLVSDLRERGLWDAVMVGDLKYFDGSLAPIDRVPEELKALYATAFEIDSTWLVEAAARRQKWIDQGQSLNLYASKPSGSALDALYKLAWRRGLKTTYYLRSQSATHVEKSTLNGTDGKLNAVAVAATVATKTIAAIEELTSAASYRPVCSIDDPECEACQ